LAGLAMFGEEFPGARELDWRLAARDATRATFIAKAPSGSETAWLSIEVGAIEGAWEPTRMGGCRPSVVISSDFGPATWALDPEAPTPGPQATAINILVWEGSCSSGSPATGRMSAPVIDYAAGAVTITLGVRGLVGLQTCPLPPGTPAIVELSEPLGDRKLLDGGRVPPAPPSPEIQPD
jgi:hypothetical protein